MRNILLITITVLALAGLFTLAWSVGRDGEKRRAEEFDEAKQTLCDSGPPKCSISSGRVGGYGSHWMTCECP